jgi:hypothetical protein
MTASLRWFYVTEGRRQGPVDVSHLVDLILTGTVPETTLIWHSGRSGWTPAREVEEVARELPPPLPEDAHKPEGATFAGLASPAVEGATGEPEAEPPQLQMPPASEAVDPRSERRRRRRHKHNHHHAPVVRSAWWARWLVPILIGLLALVIGLWLLLRRINEVPPGRVYPEPMAHGSAGSAPTPEWVETRGAAPIELRFADSRGLPRA